MDSLMKDKLIRIAKDSIQVGDPSHDIYHSLRVLNKFR